MKRFKLIKEYPGSAGLGTIITFDTNYNKYVFLYTGNDTHFYNRAPEDYPEFWEEVIEKDYEILSYTSPYDRWHSQNMIIHSVKRLSDGEIFTVGDKIKIHNKIGTITYFTKDLWAGIEGVKCNGPYKISLLNKVKQPLFTTEDGVDIHYDQMFFNVNNFKIETFQVTNDKYPLDFLNDGSKQFSTKEAAEEYIIMNKPCLSLNDIFSSHFDKVCLIKSTMIDILKEKLKL